MKYHESHLSSCTVWKFSCENLWEESFLGITLPCPREKERKSERGERGRACLQLESLTSTSRDRPCIGWTSDLDGSLGFGRCRLISAPPQRFLVLPGKLRRCDYTFHGTTPSRCHRALEIPALAREGLVCKQSTVYEERTTGVSSLRPVAKKYKDHLIPLFSFLCSAGNPYANRFSAQQWEGLKSPLL